MMAWLQRLNLGGFLCKLTTASAASPTSPFAKCIVIVRSWNVSRTDGEGEPCIFSPSMMSDRRRLTPAAFLALLNLGFYDGATPRKEFDCTDGAGVA
jgi:hypothetical protein